MSAKYNGVLVSFLKSLKSELKNINYSYFDGYSVMENIVRKPAAYGMHHKISFFFLNNWLIVQNWTKLESCLNYIFCLRCAGFAEVKAACCGLGNLKADAPCLPFSTYCSNRSNHLFWDRTHPTEAAHRVFVDYIFDGPLLYTFPLNVRKLIAI